jgi:AmmeMemoRadiSam system protein A
LTNGEKLEVSESDPLLNQKSGAFVTLNQHHELRGCIGNLTGNQPLYLTVRDMAIEAAVGDPRFSPLTASGLKEIEIDISVLSEMQKIDSADKIELGKHGVLVRKGYQSGVFLPQVAVETGWNKEEFLNNLCAHKAGLPAGAWKDKNTQLYIFTADVFSESQVKE